MKNFFIKEEGKEIEFKAKIFNTTIVFLVIMLAMYYSFTKLEYNFNWDSIWVYKKKFISGFKVTILISIFSLIISFALAMLSAFAGRSKVLLLRYFSKIYIELIRGTPLLVQILIFFYVVATSVGLNNRYVAGVLILSIFSGAYVSEIIRAGIESIDKGQFEAGKALGFGTIKKYRYIILPQVMKRIMPPLTGQFASLIKDSSLLSIISISELTMNAQEVNSYTYSTLESYIPLALGYLVLTFPISLYSRYLEKKYKIK